MSREIHPWVTYDSPFSSAEPEASPEPEPEEEPEPVVDAEPAVHEDTPVVVEETPAPKAPDSKRAPR